MIDSLRKKLPIVLVLFLTFFSYSNIIDNQFISDDKSFIVDWYQPKDLKKNLSNLLMGDLPPGQEGVYRPVRSIMYSFSYLLWQVNPRGFHIQSIIVHSIITLLTYLISRKIFKKNLPAIITALFFGIHPIHTEAVTWITSSMDTVSFIFFFGSFYLYLLFREKNITFYKILSLLLFLLSTFHYELTITLPFIIFIYEYFINKKSIKKSAIHSLSHALVLVGYLLTRFLLINTPSRARYVLDNPLQTWIIMAAAIVKYFGLLIYPKNLQYNHEIINGITGLFHFEYHTQKIIDFPSLTSPTFLASLLFILGLLIFIFKFRKKTPIISFSLSFILISLLPVLQIVPISSLFSERYAYPASFGITLIFAWVISSLYYSKKIILKYLSILIVFITSIFFIQTTYQRNTQWHNPIRFWTSATYYDKDSSYANSELAKAYSDIGNFDKAKKYTEIAIKNNPTSPINISNLAYIYLIQEDYQQAIELYKQSIEIKPNLFSAYIGMAEAFIKQNQPEIAVEIYQDLIEKNPNHIDAYLNLSALVLKDDPAGALKLVLKAKEISPHRSDIYKALGYIYIQNENIPEAQKYLSLYLTQNPADTEAIQKLKDIKNLSQ